MLPLCHNPLMGKLWNIVVDLQNSQAADRRADQRETHRVVQELESKIGILTVINHALIELLIEGGQLTHADLETRVKNIVDRECGGAGNASPEALATDLKLKTEDDSKAAAEQAEKERIAQERLRHFRRQD